MSFAHLAPTQSQASKRGPRLRALLAAVLLGFLAQPACASSYKKNVIYAEGRETQATSLESVVAQVSPGTIVIVSEHHDSRAHHDNQLRFLETLRRERANEPISVGFEFLARTFQSVIDQFVKGAISEPDFLKQVEWGKNDFGMYRAQAVFPRSSRGSLIGLNARRTLTGRIAKVGIDGLTDAERAELPPVFALGNAGYFERFKETMAGHPLPEQKLKWFFEAQSVWDETMAFTATEFIKQHPEQKLVILVGDFHAAYGGGLPDRLRARGAQKVIVISQVTTDGLSSSEIDELVRPSAKWGPRADYVWIE